MNSFCFISSLFPTVYQIPLLNGAPMERIVVSATSVLNEDLIQVQSINPHVLRMTNKRRPRRMRLIGRREFERQSRNKPLNDRSKYLSADHKTKVVSLISPANGAPMERIVVSGTSVFNEDLIQVQSINPRLLRMTNKRRPRKIRLIGRRGT
jgi:hypothetical protein